MKTNCGESNVLAQIAGFGMIGTGVMSALAMAPWTWMKADQALLLGGWCALMAVGGWALACVLGRRTPTAQR
jgi:hypothetical protein